MYVQIVNYFCCLLFMHSRKIILYHFSTDSYTRTAYMYHTVQTAN
jgi:hypothetical protein